ncbi:MAG: hypothetical protein EA342_20810 [Leptolyngbya sp. LCM1.Bin17]|nr:MAG: hypothetical protein EA342_20810 [Leptolyngbya sp. LCM1.Bin17]
MPMRSWPAMWGLTAAQAQRDAIAAALMPMDLSPSGRLQVPAIEIQDTGDRLVVTAFLPGVDPEAVQVRATPQSLTFFGQRQSEYRSLLGYGLGINHFQQTVALPARVRDRQVQVAYHQGAIVVTLPKAKTSWPTWAPSPNLGNWSDTARHQGQRLGHRWRQFKGWLGRTLRTWGNRLLEEP